MRYADGFVIPVPKRNLKAYMTIARKCAKIWRDHGALECRECAGDDLDTKCGLPFPKTINVKPGETVVFSWIVYKSRAHRDSVNKKVMNDPRMAAICDPKKMPFDCNRITCGGFKIMVDA